MANISSQRFCLRWNNHQSNLLSVFDQLLQDESFVDVTLAVDGQFLRAHKMVLSACSPYFQSLFTDHPDKHPIVILKDVPYTDMRCLLDFMYRGEVSVDQDRLTAFLKVAESLRIKGLTEVNEERCDLPSITNSLLSSQNLHSHVPPPQLHRIYQPPSLKRHQIHNNNYPSLNSAPLLGSALTAPKRKRGRPRKLSGSSDFAPGSPNSDTDASDAKTSESILPELLEVKMEYSDKDRNRESSCENERYSNGEERSERLNSDEHMAGTSHGVGRGNGHDSESFALDSSNSSDSLDQSAKNQVDGESQQSLVSVEIQTGLDVSGVPVAVISNNPEATGFHFLSREFGKEKVSQEAVTGLMESFPKARSDLLEYLQKKDGTVVCKWCGQVLPSRTHWYRHKYKNHVPGIPSGIIKCVKCNTYFKSRKGYNGHCSTRHRNGVGEDDYEEVVFEDDNAQDNSENIERASVRTAVKPKKPRQQRTMLARHEEYMKQREEEEKLVADIIAKVKKECESQSVTMARRGYSRRHTVMSAGSDFDGKRE